MITESTKVAGANVNGNTKRFIHDAIQDGVRDILTPVLDSLDAAGGQRLKASVPSILAELAESVRKHSAAAPKLFSSASTYVLDVVVGKKTNQCFTSKLWGYRDGDFDSWLPAGQPNTDAGTITVLTPMKDWTFAEAAVSVLNVASDTPLATLAKLLKERGHTMTLAQIEAMTEATEHGKSTGMVSNGWGSFAFVENKDGSVSVAYVFRLGGGRPWDADVRGLSYDRRWFADYRLLVCNLDLRALGL